ncbi:helix-turn-helix domain-containing protein (plasmid) [Alicyclobacillus sp. ALC3]|nr:helix-turn-helix domain-containing protein [Alicyclobacillus sp. ALC3]
MGEQIKSHRKKMGMSQTELAKLVGVSQGHISHLESNEKQPSLSILADIAKVFGVTISRLIGDTSALGSGAYDVLDISIEIDQQCLHEQFGEARRLIDEARNMPYFSDLHNLAALEVSLAITYVHEENHEAAVRILKPWFERLGELGPGLAVEVLYWLGYATRLAATSTGSEKIEEALAFLREAKSVLAFVDRRSRLETRAMVELELGYCYRDIGASDKALESLQQANALLSPRVAYMDRQLAYLTLAMAEEYERAQNWEQCVDGGMRARDLFRNIVRDAEGECKALHTVAKALVALGRREDALKTYHEAYALAKDTSLTMVQAISESAASSGFDLGDV